MNPGTARVRIVVASPRELARDALAALLSAQPGFGVEARVSYGNDLLEQVRLTTPDILLFECDQPGTMWLSRLRAASGLPKPPKSVLLSGSLSEESILEGVESGLWGVVTPDGPTEMLFKSIRCVSAGEYWIGHERIADMMDFLRRKKHGTKTGPPNQLGLTTRERDVICALLTGASNKEIAELLAISSQAVRHHLCSIFEKLGVSNRLELALFAMQRGVCCRSEIAAFARQGQ